MMKLGTIKENHFTCHDTLKNHLPLLEKAKQVFKPGDEVRFFKAPGRVNLIGEHTDYNMCPVLPCAVDREIVFCARTREDKLVKLANVEDFPDVEFSISYEIELGARGDWGNYVKAGIEAVLAHHQHRDWVKQKGFEAIVSSSLPRAAGMSSSSALVVVSAITLLGLAGISVGEERFAEECAKAERLVGTAGGAMDHTASLMGEKDSFLKIDFDPLRVVDNDRLRVKVVKAPAGVSLVLCDSLTRAEKTGRARDEYNRRVVECRLAVELFKKYLAKQRLHDPRLQYIGYINERVLGRGCEEKVDDYLKWLKPVYDMPELAGTLEMEEKEVRQSCLRIGEGDYLEPPADGFKPLARFLHVYWEWKRVEEAATKLAAGDSRAVGKLMDESQESMAKHYEISTPELDALCEAARQAGAMGARLTGAGFGGCVVALLEQEKVDGFTAELGRLFYGGGDTQGHVFVCRPSSGAGEIILD